MAKIFKCQNIGSHVQASIPKEVKLLFLYKFEFCFSLIFCLI